METIEKLDDTKIKVITTYERIMTKEDLFQEKELKEREIFVLQEELNKINSKLDVLKAEKRTVEVEVESDKLKERK